MNNKIKVIRFLTLFFLLFCSYGFSRSKNRVLLDEYLKEAGFSKFETGIFSGKTIQPEFISKIVKSNPFIRVIGEIGFNAGHSSLIFLEANSDVFVYSFDIMEHDYVQVAKNFIDRTFPNRHHLIPGDSAISVPLFKRENPLMKFDLIYIDGGHSYQSALQDIENMRDLAHKDTILIIDDIQFSGVNKAYKECVDRNLISEGNIEKSGHKGWLISKYVF